MKSEFELAFGEVSEQRSLTKEMVLEALSTALTTAYQRDSGIGKAQRVEAYVDQKTWRTKILVEKEVVEDVQDERTEVLLETARFYDPEAQLGDMVMVAVERSTKQLGRIAAQTAKQVILQKIREAERNTLYDMYQAREGEIINTIVQGTAGGNITLALGKTEGLMPRRETIPREKYKQHDRIRAYILEVRKTTRGPQIILSRAHRNMLRRLLEYEVPEIQNGQVEVKNIAREAGSRSKVAVAALQEGIDPVGACVGIKGQRIQSIVKELCDEKIDVIEWSPNQEVFIANALSPARPSGVYLEDDPDQGRTAVVIVPDEALSNAIGKEGQNARLAAKLTGWRIDIKSVSDAVNEALENLNAPPLRDIRAQYPDMLADVERIMEKRAAGRVVVQDEFKLLARFADLVQRRIMQSREAARQQRLKEINAVNATLPPAAFHMPISSLGISDNLVEALLPLENVGEIMLRYLIDENRLRALLRDQPEDSIEVVRAALDRLVIPDDLPIPPAPAVETVPSELPTLEPALEGEAGRTAARREFRPAAPELELDVADDFDDDDDKGKKGGKGKKKGRQLVFDEKAGGMVVKRQRKRGGRGDWNEWEE
jgi:N utilization substance protein A